MLASLFVLSTLVSDTHAHTRMRTHEHAFARTCRQLLIITVTLPGEKEVTRSSQWGLRMVVKVNEADGSVFKCSVKKKSSFEE